MLQAQFNQQNYAAAAAPSPQPAQPVSQPQPMPQPEFSYPKLRDDKRNIFNSTIESVVRLSSNLQANNDIINQIVGVTKDLGENYINMINANYISTPEMQNKGTTIDNYYHCIGNYDAAKTNSFFAKTIIGRGNCATCENARDA